jgi:hypothetical protein
VLRHGDFLLKEFPESSGGLGLGGI